MDKEQNKRMAEYVMDQLSGLSGVRKLPMMGGYLFYYNDRVFGGIYSSGELLIKIQKPAKSICRTVNRRYPMRGRKRCFRVRFWRIGKSFSKW